MQHLLLKHLSTSVLCSMCFCSLASSSYSQANHSLPTPKDHWGIILQIAGLWHMQICGKGVWRDVQAAGCPRKHAIACYFSQAWCECMVYRFTLQQICTSFNADLLPG